MNILNIVKELVSNNQYYQNINIYNQAKSFNELPILLKKDVIENYSLISNPRSDSIIYTYTSGSTGIPLKIVWNYDEYLTSIKWLWKYRKLFCISPRYFYITCHALINLNNDAINEPIVISRNYVSFSKIIQSDSTLSEYIRIIRMLSPVWIHAQPSFIYQLGMFMKHNAPDLLSEFRYIELVGELIPENVRNEIEKLFSNAKVVSMYGMQEFNCVMYEKNNLMYQCDNNVFVEILNDNGQICDIDEEGRIVVSGLLNSAFPLIRYDTGDRGKKICLNNDISYAITQARSNDQLVHKGKKFDGSIFFYIVNKLHSMLNINILSFQVIKKDNQLTFYFSVSNEKYDDVTIKHTIEDIMISNFGISIPLSVEIKKYTCESYVFWQKNKIFY
ncbi:MAG: AMP-binding protein [Clostridiales bacterium]|nr:AMP-binding protein [Clostridiales bacterium]